MKLRHGVLGLLIAAVMVPGCGDEETEPQGACSPGQAGGCGEGQECVADASGNGVCACSVASGSGCGEGLECQAVAGGTPSCFCSPGYQSGCEEGQVCELVEGSNTACFDPVTVRGLVFDMATDAPVEGALVVARNVNNVVVTDVAVTDAAGNYELAVPTRRSTDGALLETQVSLRADAEGYITFPTAPRSALPFDTSNAAGEPPVLETIATEIGLLPVESTAGLGTIQGHVLADHPRGTLLVAGGAPNAGGGVTGIADFDGSYTIFNVPAGTVAVKGYAAGLQLVPASADVSAGEITTGVDLSELGAATAAVSGKVEIVNPGDGDDTSVILVVDETFVANTASGEAPPGLRAGEVSGQWHIDNVPDGHYVVLAAFENDFLVRDPDTSIGGTELVRITVSGSSVDLAEGFKITGSLAVVSPDAEEHVTGTPSFVWEDDSSEDHYEIRVFDVFGQLVWEKLDVPGVSGSDTVTQAYEGTALESGLLYQFRATSIKQGGTPISRTEDLKGVFFVP